MILCSASGLYARARKERILDLVSGYDREEEVNRTTVLLRAKRHFFKAETLLAAKNVILNHRNYGVSCALLVISLCVFLNGMTYVRGLAAPYEEGQDYPRVSLWAKTETGGAGTDGGAAKGETLEELAGRIEGLEGVAQVSVVKEAEDYNATEGLSFAEIKAYLEELHVWRNVDLYESDHFDAREKELQAQMALHYLVRIVGVDEATFRRYLRYGEEQGGFVSSSASR